MSGSVIQIRGLKFSWSGTRNPLIRLERFDVEKAEKLFLYGASGCGKSTLLGLLTGVLEPQHGLIEVLGQGFDKLNAASKDQFRADHFGIIFQQFNLIPYLSVIENVVLPCQFSALRRHRATSQSKSPEQEAWRLLDHLDMAENGLVDTPVSELSVGQQQRVAAARAIIGMPEIIIADEPTSSMDSARRSAFIQLLFRECEMTQSTLIFVSHDLDRKEAFDRVVSFDQLNRAALGPAVAQ